MSYSPAQARRWAVVGLLALHAFLLGYSAERHSPGQSHLIWLKSCNNSLEVK